MNSENQYRVRNTAWISAVLTLVLLGCSGDSDPPAKPARHAVERKETTSADKRPTPPSPDSSSAAPTLSEALKIAADIHDRFKQSVRDYTCTLVTEELVGDQFLTQRMCAKIRNPRSDGKTAVPFSVYLKFTAPEKVKGREVLFVANLHGGWLRAHETGARGIATFELNPTGAWAMRENRHPITETGILRLLEQLIEKGKAVEKCPKEEFEVTLGASEIEKRKCQSLQIIHKNRDHDFDFHIVRIDIDDKLRVPIHYEAFDWPRQKGGKPVLLEAYSYLDLKLNTGLTDDDFQYDNSAYAFPRRVIREGTLAFRSLGFLDKLFQ